MAKFKTRARTIDMLGRQQIAGIPSAISELFKNAHDAYADRVEVDYFRSDGLFVLRDDGLGMTQDDFEQRWLTLGTESKLGKDGLKMPPLDPKKKSRRIMGEKGIGRLAIAVIGPQVLVLSRAERDGNLENIIAAFIHWGLFECPGINLDEINIPVQIFSSLPDAEDIRKMVSQVINNLTSLKSHLEELVFSRIMADLQGFKADLHDSVFKDLSLASSRGTQFYIFPTSENLQAELDIDEKAGQVSKLKKLLVGFTNTMEENKRAPIATAFRYWKTDEHPTDYVSDRTFFTSEEFRMADHHIEGSFDEFGHFSGTVTVYNEDPVAYVCPWTEAYGKLSACGPFKFSLAYVQGEKKASKLVPEEWVKITGKLDLIAGLYIYKNGIRVLPYGDSDFDWLDLEKNRSKSASYYFFTYRRLYGAIDISSDNHNLVEKAGREGFQENKAYRQFQGILKRFFVQLAADFFREGGSHADTFIDSRSRLDDIDKARKAREKKSKARRQKFELKLTAFFDSLENGHPTKAAVGQIGKLEQDLLSVKIAEPEQGAADLLSLERSFDQNFKKLIEKYTLTLGGGLALTKRLNTEWQVYQEERKQLEETLFRPEQERGKRLITEYAAKHNLVLDKRKRAAQALDDTISHIKNLVRKEVRDVKASFNTTQTRITQLTRNIISSTKETTSHIEKQFHGTDLSDMSYEEINAFRLKLEAGLEQTAEEGRVFLEDIRSQLQNIKWEKDKDYIGNAAMDAALEEEVLALRERVDTDLEITQLGMAIEVINHEFDSSIRTIRESLRTLKGWADINPKMVPIYSKIRNAFDHLDGYLTMFTPLHRRLYRKEIEIQGADIANYLEDIFSERIKRHSIRIESTEPFRKKTISGYPSTFYPVFINLLDNAIFWLKSKQGSRLIQLDAVERGFRVSDNGPGIPIRSRDSIFQRGYSTKPGGRGLGLFISREVLAKVGYDLQLERSLDQGTSFTLVRKD